MQSKALSAREIIGIIKAGSEAGVCELKFSGLEIAYYPDPSQRHVEEPINIQQTVQNWEGPATVRTSGGDFDVETDEKLALEQEEYIRAQELVVDPVAHEEEMVKLATSGG
jgi:hypothetical protein